MSAKVNVVETAKKAEVSAIVSGTMNTSQKIRELATMGVPRAEIALLLNKRYQHVRNVLQTKLVEKKTEETTTEEAPAE